MEMVVETRPVIGGSVSAIVGTPFAPITPVSPSYASLPVLEGFNWSECLHGVDAGQWFLVTFRSVRKPTADNALLNAYDDHAFAEAMAFGGLLCYFRGELDDQRRCLSLCVWEHAEQARDASRLPLHIAAAHLVKDMYESYVVGRQLLVKRPGSSAPELVPVGPAPASALPTPPQ